VTGHLHRDPLGDACTNEIANGSPSKVVQETSWTSCRMACRSECGPNSSHRLASPVEDPRDNLALLPLETLRDGSLLFKQLAKVCRHWERAAFTILGGAWVKADLAGDEVNLPPLERQDLTLGAPTRDATEQGKEPRSYVLSSKDRQFRPAITQLNENVSGFVARTPVPGPVPTADQRRQIPDNVNQRSIGRKIS
jgi:hypothetical protein